MRRWGPAGLWAVFTVAAVASGLVAVALIGQSVSSETVPVLSAAQVKESLVAAPRVTPSAEPGQPGAGQPGAGQAGSGQQGSATTTPTDHSSASGTPRGTGTPSGTPTSSPRPNQPPTQKPPPSIARTLTSRGGTVVAECQAGSVYLRSWSPANGFRVHEVVRGPAVQALVKFESSTSEVKFTVRCVSGSPIGVQEVDDGGSSNDSETD